MKKATPFNPPLRIFIINLIVIFLFSGCTTFYNPATGKKEFIAISTYEEVKMGEDIHNKLKKKFKFSKDKEKLDKLQKIGERVVLVSDRQDYKYNFFLVNNDELNAFTTPGGNIYVNTGIIDKLTTDDQIASVIAHEVAHCAARHTVKKFQVSLGYDFVGDFIFNNVQMSNMTKQVASLGADFVVNIIFSAYSRKDEYEADKIGIKYLYLSGYNPSAIVEVLDILLKESKGFRGFLVLRSHPYLEDRIKVARSEMKVVKSRYK
ncbi:MAG: M48 family metalloprotease [Candidatus Zapsychrus exili]|nr:M48 family metalloprotease [Candidatus Zapsychrus exili]